MLKEPKQRGRTKSLGTGRGHGATMSSGAVASRSPSKLAAAAVPAADDDDEIEMVGERSWQQRDQELRSHAILLE